MTEKTKRCPACTRKPCAAFDENPARKDGLQYRCRLCTAAYAGGSPLVHIQDWYARARHWCDDPTRKEYSEGAGCEITLDELYVFVVVRLGFDTNEKMRDHRIRRIDTKRGYCVENLTVSKLNTEENTK